MLDWVSKMYSVFIKRFYETTLTIFLFIQIKQQLGFDVDTSYVNEGCMTVGYGFLGDYTDINAPEYERYHKLMKIFAKQNDFKMETDVKALTAGKQKEIYEYLEAN